MKRNAIKGWFWLTVDLGGGQLFSFAIFLVLARLLAPEEYGVFALAGSFIALIYLLFQGLSSALLHRDGLDDEAISTAFWCSISLGALASGLLAIAAPWLALAFGMPELTAVLLWMSPIAVLMAATMIPMTLLRRRLELSAFAARSILGYGVGGATSIGLAVHGWGVASLAIGQLAQWIATAAVVYAICGWRPTLRFSPGAAREIGSFSVKSISAMLVLSITAKLDVIIVGAFLDAKSLGYYSLAVRLVQTVITVVLQPFVSLTMPVLSRLRADRGEFTRTYTGMVLGANSIWLPIIAGTGVLAPQIVPLVFGAPWTGSVLVLQAMCLSAFTEALNIGAGQVLSARGQLGAYNVLMLVQLALSAAAFGIGVQFGAAGVGLAWAAISILMLPVVGAFLRTYGGIDVRTMLAEGLRVGIAGVGMVVAMLTIRDLTSATSPLWTIAGTASAGAIAYLLILETVTLPGYLMRVIRLARSAFPRLMEASGGAG